MRAQVGDYVRQERYCAVSSMHIMTTNLWNSNVSVESFGEALDRHAPDIVAAQELDHPAARELTSRYPYGEVRPGGIPGCALVSNRPIEVSAVDLPFRPYLKAPVVVGDRLVTVGAVHIANPVASSDIPFRRSQVRALLQAIEGDDPLVLVGDFNSSPAWPAYRLIRRHMRDGVADWAERVGTRAPRTWNHRANWPKVLRIDHIMVRGVAIKSLETVDITGTDHRALIAEIE